MGKLSPSRVRVRLYKRINDIIKYIYIYIYIYYIYIARVTVVVVAVATVTALSWLTPSCILSTRVSSPMILDSLKTAFHHATTLTTSDHFIQSNMQTAPTRSCRDVPSNILPYCRFSTYLSGQSLQIRPPSS